MEVTRKIRAIVTHIEPGITVTPVNVENASSEKSSR